MQGITIAVCHARTHGTAIRLRWLACLFFLCCFTFSLSAYAIPLKHLHEKQGSYDLDGAFEYFEDSSAIQTIDEVRSLPDIVWQRLAKETPNFGFSHSAFWFRLAVEPHWLEKTYLSHKWLLEIDYPMLDSIILFSYQGDNLLQHIHTGDMMPFDERILPFRDFVIPLELAENRQTTIYLRIASKGAIQVPMNLRTEIAFIARDDLETAGLALFFGILLAMTLHNLFIYLQVRELSYLYFMLHVLTFVMFIVSLTGWGYKYFWPEMVEFQQYSVTLSMTLSAIFAARFIHFFLDLPKHAPLLGRILCGVVAALLLSLLITPFGFFHSTAQLSLLLIFIVSFIGLYAGITLWLQGVVAARYFTIAWSSFLIAAILASLGKFGLMPDNFWTENFLQVGMTLEVILLSLALGERLQRERQELIRSQQEIIHIEKKHSEELEEKVAKRTTQLAQANKKLEEQATTDALTSLKNRHLLFEQGDQLLELSRRYKHPVSLIMLDIDHFKSVNDSYGHLVGDQVLKHIAEIMRMGNRKSDIAVRLGGEELCLLLPETDAAAALSVAERIRRGIENAPTEHEGQKVAATASFGVATIEPDNRSADLGTLLKEADDALYRAKKSGRNCVVMAS